MQDDQEDDGGDDDGFGWVANHSPETLRARWLYECKVVRALEKAEWDHAGGPSAALQAAKMARDRAEGAWRSSLRPKPVAMRMANSQRKVDRARKAVERAEDALRRHEEEAELKRQELQQALGAAEERCAARQLELDELLKEAGDIAAANAVRGQPAAAAGGNASRFQETLAQDFQEFIETLEEGSEARGRANLLLAKWATDEEPPARQHFVIATDGEESEGAGAFLTVGRRGRPMRSSSSAHGSVQAGAGATWNETAAGRWSKARAGEQAGQHQTSSTGRAAETNAAGGSGEPTPTAPPRQTRSSCTIGAAHRRGHR